MSYLFNRRAMITALVGASFMLAGQVWAQDKPTVKIGFIGPLSGGNAQQGLGARNGFRLALEQINAQADYPFQVEGIELDDASDPQTGVSAALKLVNDADVVAATGHWNSPVALATSPVFGRFQIPLVVWGAISPAVTAQGIEQVTRVTPTLLTENKPLAEWVVSELKATKIAIVADTSDYGTSNADSFAQYIREAGGEIASTDLLPVGTTDFRAILTKIRADNPDALYFGGVITEAGILRRQMKELGLDMPMVAISGIYDVEFINVAGEASEGVLSSYPITQTNPLLEKMEADYAARGFSEPTNPYTKYTYDATNIILAALKEVGKDDKNALTQAIRKTNHEGTTGTVTFDENGQTQIPVAIEMRVVKDGKWGPLTQ